MKPTITDIAKDTGLSLATISKYLNHKPVLPENERRIQESIERLGYTPNRIAQSLRSKKTSTIAIIIPPLGDCLWGSIIYPMESTLRKNGYTTIICTNSSDLENPRPLSAFLLHNQIDGAIVIDGALSQEDLTLFSKNGLPVVLVDGSPKEEDFDLVSSDNYESAYQAGLSFIQNHHTRIGFVAGKRDSYTTAQRTRGFLDALKACRIPLCPQYYSYGDSSSASAQKQFRELMSLKEPPTALFFSSYASFLGGLMEIMNQNLKIPGDLSIISFDNDKIFDTLTPKITVIQQDFPAIGQKAATLLLKRLKGDLEGFPEHCLVKTLFLERDSVACLHP